jgi:hypothetical protein
MGCVLLLLVALGACGTTQNYVAPPLPGGTYTSAPYHFKIQYPAGWSATVAGCDATQVTGSGCATLGGTATSNQPSAAPLQITITHTAQHTTTAPTVSTFSITVLDLSVASVAAQAAGIAQDTGLHPTNLAGLPAYASTPSQQALPGAGGTPSATLVDVHTDYYLVHGGYEYLISVDMLSGDSSQADLDAMLRSFALSA